MRHDPAAASLVIMLRELKMFGMAQAISELAEQGAPAYEAAQPVLAQLLKAETAEREDPDAAHRTPWAAIAARRISVRSSSASSIGSRRRPLHRPASSQAFLIGIGLCQPVAS